MQKYMLGFMTAYTILVSCYAAGMHTGRIASIQQACVERSTVSPADYVEQLGRGRHD